MRVAIDGRLVNYRRGMGNYAYNLLRAFARSDEDFELVVFIDDSKARIAIPNDKRISIRVLRPALYPFWEQYLFPKALRHERVDIVHSLFNTGPLHLDRSLATRLVLTVHDIMYLLPATTVPQSPTFYHKMGRSYRAFVVSRAIEKASAIITVSKHSKSDIESFFCNVDVPIHVIPLAPDPDVARSSIEDDLQATRNQYTSGRYYVLAFGALDPRKNSQRIIEAFARALLPKDHVLLMTGLSERAQKVFEEIAQSCGVFDRVVFKGFIPSSEMPKLYRGASILVYPSLYEGFGLPVLEAQSCDLPVITSEAGSLKDVAGNAAIIVNPINVDQIANAITMGVLDPKLRLNLINAGRENASCYSWDRTAAATLLIYKGLI